MTIRRPALLIAYGPEMRAFLHSGLHQRLVETGTTPVIFAGKPSSKVFDSLRREELQAYPQEVEPAAMQRLRSLSRRTQGRGLAGMAERLTASLVGGTAAWKRVLANAGVDAVICASHNSARTLPALQTASNLGLPTIVFENSWKDVRRRAYAPARPTALGFATEAALDAYADANGTPAEFDVCGSLHLSALDRAGFLDRPEFCRLLGLDASRPIVCYSTARAGVVEDELGWAQRLLRRFRQMRGARAQLLVRTNPMDEFDAFASLGDRTDVAVLRPIWEWDPSADWCCPQQEDSLLWSSAIRHAALNVSVASTVTMEFAAFGRPVINPVLGAKAIELFDSSFYGEARRYGWAEPAFSLTELEDLVVQRLEAPRKPIQSAPRFDAASKALELVRRVGAVGEKDIAVTRLSSVRA